MTLHDYITEALDTALHEDCPACFGTGVEPSGATYMGLSEMVSCSADRCAVDAGELANVVIEAFKRYHGE